jgi:hypothetical protein
MDHAKEVLVATSMLPFTIKEKGRVSIAWLEAMAVGATGADKQTSSPGHGCWILGIGNGGRLGDRTACKNDDPDECDSPNDLSTSQEAIHSSGSAKTKRCPPSGIPSSPARKASVVAQLPDPIAI